MVSGGAGEGLIPEPQSKQKRQEALVPIIVREFKNESAGRDQAN